MRRFAWLGAALALGGCGDLGGGALSAFGESDAPPLREASLFGGEVVVSGPPGYCIERGSLAKRRGGHVLLIASCESLSGAPDMAVDPAVMTVSVLPRDGAAVQPSADELAATLRPARVFERIDGDGVAIVHLATGGEVGIPGGDAAHWRAAMLINGHLTGLALYAPKGSRVARGAAGQALMIELAERLRARSPVRRAVAQSDGSEVPEADATLSTSTRDSSTGSRGFFSRLFPNES
ncbi:hypothetical protein K1T73_16495 [Roseovarius sp. SCSIO 43702]|uniref:hypothetical protein n=1 Tax=Roseovarius sp. SCSIO 43702 TaxID=2823043 RepID=UPI001C7395D3|nr:hypothetical protein [Roseovarius sp. SCSIO 43702]QYX56616.1 hypothetical protein K1T73_16495 [Roseovarius sp. SCSIO 43702]